MIMINLGFPDWVVYILIEAVYLLQLVLEKKKNVLCTSRAFKENPTRTEHFLFHIAFELRKVNLFKRVFAKNERGYRLLIATNLTSICCFYKEKFV